jgi:hypothetical protein
VHSAACALVSAAFKLPSRPWSTSLPDNATPKETVRSSTAASEQHGCHTAAQPPASPPSPPGAAAAPEPRAHPPARALWSRWAAARSSWSPPQTGAGRPRAPEKAEVGGGGAGVGRISREAQRGEGRGDLATERVRCADLEARDSHQPAPRSAGFQGSAPHQLQRSAWKKESGNYPGAAAAVAAAHLPAVFFVALRRQRRALLLAPPPQHARLRGRNLRSAALLLCRCLGCTGEGGEEGGAGGRRVQSSTMCG